MQWRSLFKIPFEFLSFINSKFSTIQHNTIQYNTLMHLKFNLLTFIPGPENTIANWYWRWYLYHNNNKIRWKTYNIYYIHACNCYTYREEVAILFNYTFRQKMAILSKREWLTSVLCKNLLEGVYALPWWTLVIFNVHLPAGYTPPHGRH